MDRQEAIDLILDHYHHPRNRRAMPDATFSAEGINPGCGDVVRMHVRLNGGDHVAEVSFDGRGCTISQAAASLMTEMAAGHTLEELMAIDQDTLIEALGRDVVINRTRCATLALDTLKKAVRQHQNGR